MKARMVQGLKWTEKSEAERISNASSWYQDMGLFACGFAYVVDDVPRACADGDEAVLRADDQAAAVLAPVAARDAPLVLAGARRHLVARAPVVQDQRAWASQQRECEGKLLPYKDGGKVSALGDRLPHRSHRPMDSLLAS